MKPAIIVLVAALAVAACGGPAPAKTADDPAAEPEMSADDKAALEELEKMNRELEAAISETKSLTEKTERALAEAKDAQAGTQDVIDDATRVLSGVPFAPGHVLQPSCPFPAERMVCVRIPGEVSRNDEEGDARLVADYVERFEKDGWRVMQEGPRPVLTKTSRCVRLEAVIWDYGRSARMRFERILRVEFDPEGVACSR
jgi:hypothetical protein